MGDGSREKQGLIMEHILKSNVNFDVQHSYTKTFDLVLLKVGAFMSDDQLQELNDFLTPDFNEFRIVRYPFS